MRILLSCLQSPRLYPLTPYEHWRRYLFEGLTEAGHEVLEVPEVDWVEPFFLPNSEIEHWKTRTWETVETFVSREAKRLPIDLFVSYLYPCQIDQSAIQLLRHKGVVCTNFFCDNVRDFVKVPPEYTGFDVHWVPEYEALSMYRRAGLPHVFAAMPCWIPQELRSAPLSETESPCFVGSKDPLRQDLLADALDRGAEFSIFGAGWIENGQALSPNRPSAAAGRLLLNQLTYVQRYGPLALFRKIQNRLYPLRPRCVNQSKVRGAVSASEYFRISREAAVTIGVNRAPGVRHSIHRPPTYSRLRDVEAPMLGACYLTEWTEGLEHMYELGSEVETYRTAEELTAKLAKLRRDHTLRSTLRKRGQHRALTEHSIKRTMERLAERVGITAR